MNRIKIFLLIFGALSVQSCGSRKSATASATVVHPDVSSAPSNPFPLVLPPDGTKAPGDHELAAIRVTNKEATMELLKEGHTIYTTGACVNCHGTANIYQYGEAQWEKIIDDMSQRAAISDAQKNALRNYVMAMKATQPK